MQPPITPPSPAGRKVMAVSAVQPQQAPRTSLEVGYDKRLMLFSGRANPELAARSPAGWTWTSARSR